MRNQGREVISFDKRVEYNLKWRDSNTGHVDGCSVNEYTPYRIEASTNDSPVAFVPGQPIYSAQPPGRGNGWKAVEDIPQRGGPSSWGPNDYDRGFSGYGRGHYDSDEDDDEDDEDDDDSDDEYEEGNEDGYW